MNTASKVTSMGNLFQLAGIDYNQLLENTGVDIEEKNIKIKSFNHKTNQVEFKRIHRLVRKQNSEMYKISSRDFSFMATPEHKLYTKEFGYIEIKDIKNDCNILLDTNEFSELILEKLEGTFPVLDVTVEDNENYFSNRILSHNSPEKYGIGESMKFNASIRIKVSKADAEKNEETGQESVLIKANVFKNKVGVPFRKAEFTLLTGRPDKDGNPEYGIDAYAETLDYSIKYDFIKKAGAWYSYGEERLGQGAQSAIQWMKANPDTYKLLRDKVSSTFLEKGKLLRSNALDIAIEDAKENNSGTRRKAKKEDPVMEEIMINSEKVVEAEVKAEV